MNHIYYTNITNMVWKDIEQTYLSIVSIADREEILKLRFEKDRIRSLVGKILLLHLLDEHSSWHQSVLPPLSYNEYKKPQIEKNLDLGFFNISHSGDIVVCVYNAQSDVGIDVEKIIPVDINEFREVLTDKEYDILREKADCDFFRFWTIKEAVMKCVGKGFYLDPRSFCIPIDSQTRFSLVAEKKNLHVEVLFLHSDYILAIAQYSLEDIVIRKLETL